MSFIKSVIILIMMAALVTARRRSKEEREAAEELATVIPTLEAHLKWRFNIVFRDRGKVSFIAEASSVFDLLEISNFYNDMVVKFEKYDYNHFDDEDLKRQIKLLIAQENVLDENSNEQKNEILLKSILGTNDIQLCRYEDRKDCEMTLDEVHDEVFNTNDVDKIEYYWTEEAEKAEISEDFEKLLVLYRDIAKRKDYDDPATLVLSEYEDEKIFSKVTQIIEELNPFYHELHAHVRHMLSKQYGQDIVSPDGLIRDDLLHKFLNSLKRTDAHIDYPYPELPLTNISEVMVQKGFTPRKIIELADEFFINMNMTKMPGKQWGDIRKSFNTANCRPEVVDLNARDAIGLYYCDDLSYKNLIFMHKEMTKIQNFLNTRHLSLAYRFPPWDGYHDAMGVAILLSAASPDYLKKIGLLEVEYNDEANINRLYEMALNVFFEFYTSFVGQKYFLDVLNREVGPHGYNCHLWKLLGKYAGIKPPVPRTAEHFDVSIVYPSQTNMGTLGFLFQHIVGFKLYERMCRKAEKYRVNDPTTPLNQCDFSNSAIAGDLLRELMSMGATKPWYQALKDITHYSAFDSKPMLKYFEPLYDWLKEENKKNGVRVGWDPIKTCKNDDDAKRKK